MAQTSRFIFTPYSAEFAGTAFPQVNVTNDTTFRPILVFDATVDETCYWTAIAPQGLTGNLVLKIYYIMASATSGDVIVRSAVEAVTDGDATNLDAGVSFDTVNDSAATAVPGTAGYMDVISLTLANKDNIAAGDYFRVSLTRYATSGSDTAAGDMNVLSVEFTDGN